MSKFFVLGLPRSRTYWLAEFLGCEHEALYYYPDYAEFVESDHVGDSTTCYLQIKDFIKGEKKVVIHRNIDDVKESLHELFGDVDTAFLYEAQEGLKNERGALHVNFDDVDSRIEEIWHYCIDADFPTARYLRMKDQVMNNEFMIEVTRQCLQPTEN